MTIQEFFNVKTLSILNIRNMKMSMTVVILAFDSIAPIVGFNGEKLEIVVNCCCKKLRNHRLCRENERLRIVNICFYS